MQSVQESAKNVNKDVLKISCMVTYPIRQPKCQYHNIVGLGIFYSVVTRSYHSVNNECFIANVRFIAFIELTAIVKLQ